jgi:hypothetical protein
MKHKFSLRVSIPPPIPTENYAYPLKRRLGAPRADLNTLEKQKFSYSYHDPLVVQALLVHTQNEIKMVIPQIAKQSDFSLEIH